MVFTDFLTDTRKRWLKAFKVFNGNKSHKISNRVSPALIRSPSYSGTVDAREDIAYCRSSMPPISPDHSSEDDSCYSYGSYGDSSPSSDDAGHSSDSAYDSSRSSPTQQRTPVCFATVTYFNVADRSEDTSSIRTEYTVLDYEEDMEEDEAAQNVINENIEIVSSL